jgi:uncharacterized protein (TIGR03435 family)
MHTIVATLASAVLASPLRLGLVRSHSTRLQRRRRRLVALSLGLGLALYSGVPGGAVPVLAQTPAAPERPLPLETFDVISVQPSSTGGVSRITMPTKGGFRATNVSLPMLIRFAYQVQDFQITGRVRWIDLDTFDIEARRTGVVAPSSGDTTRLRARVRRLLADKFQLKLRTETKDLPLYELVRARPDGPLGPQLRPSKLDCSALAREFGRGGPGAAPSADLTRCGVRMQPGLLAGGGATIADLAVMLSRVTGRAVHNRTQLDGSYDLQVEFFHELAPPPEELAAFATTAQPPSIDGSAEVRPSIFTALQDQLGLRLRPTRGPVEVLVITNVERPAP